MKNANPNAGQPPRGKILVVDDSSDILETTRMMLEIKKYAVVTTTDANQVEALVKQERPVLLILDYVMQDLDFSGVCRRLKQDPATRDIKILAFTCISEESRVASMYRSGIDDYLCKPFEMQVLFNKVEKLLSV